MGKLKKADKQVKDLNKKAEQAKKEAKEEEKKGTAKAENAKKEAKKAEKDGAKKQKDLMKKMKGATPDGGKADTQDDVEFIEMSEAMDNDEYDLEELDGDGLLSALDKIEDELEEYDLM